MLPLSQGTAMKQKTIVIVDDSIELTQGYQQALEFEGYQVFLSASGRDALELLDRIPPPDLLLVDCLMPEMSGTEFLIELRNRKQELMKGTPIVALTGLFRESAQLDEMRRMISRLAEKPNTIDQLVKLVKETIR